MEIQFQGTRSFIKRFFTIIIVLVGFLFFGGVFFWFGGRSTEVSTVRNIVVSTTGIDSIEITTESQEECTKWDPTSNWVENTDFDHNNWKFKQMIMGGDRKIVTIMVPRATKQFRALIKYFTPKRETTLDSNSISIFPKQNESNGESESSDDEVLEMYDDVVSVNSTYIKWFARGISGIAGIGSFIYSVYRLYLDSLTEPIESQYECQMVQRN